MDEDAFRDTYHRVNATRCVFEKALNSRQCRCHLARHFILAGRDGFGCRASAHQARCREFLDTLRQRARFALGVTRADQPLPHAREIRVQNGGLRGLAALLDEAAAAGAEPPDIATTIDHALARYGSVESLPYGELVKSILRYEARPRRRRR